jgi:hypothetical protein
MDNDSLDNDSLENRFGHSSLTTFVRSSTGFCTKHRNLLSKLFRSAANVVEWRQLARLRRFANNRSRILEAQ